MYSQQQNYRAKVYGKNFRKTILNFPLFYLLNIVSIIVTITLKNKKWFGTTKQIWYFNSYLNLSELVVVVVVGLEIIEIMTN